MKPDPLVEKYGPRESMEFDVVIVGAGPAGLAAAIRLSQLARQQQKEISVCVLDKGSEAGAHILSGAIMDPRALFELFPDWQTLGAPLQQAVTDDQFLFLNQHGSKKTPNFLLPDCFKNHGNYIVSLGEVCKWLAVQAEQLGVDIFSGFAASELLYDQQGAVQGVVTGNMGIDKRGEPTAHFQLGMELRAKYTLFAEGSRGHLGRQLITRYQLDTGKDPQSYALGLKELWEVAPEKHRPGLVIHTSGWPLNAQTYGGSFIYHLADNKVAVGFVVGLDYSNPWLSPFEEFQRFKTHPSIRDLFDGGRRLEYGARAITAGGLLSLPQTIFPGGALIGCDAGYLNASRIKGSHAAIKSGMLCANATFDAVIQERQQDLLSAYPEAFRASWLYRELQQAKNFKQWFKKGRRIGALMTGIEQWLLPRLRINTPPWTLHHSLPDHMTLKPAAECKKIDYPKADGILTFDRLSSVFISNTNHEENQPAHLRLTDPIIATQVNLAIFSGPESRYCPAGVYEFVEQTHGNTRLQINAQNCLHCKACDIKDPTQNITWVPPEGGGGPNYRTM